MLASQLGSVCEEPLRQEASRGQQDALHRLAQCQHETLLNVCPFFPRSL